MSLTVTQRPNQNNAFVATGNPIIYKMTRKDYATNSVTNSGGFALVKVTGDITGILTVGDQIYLELDNGAIASTGTISAKSFATGETSITTSIAYVAGSTGWINLLTYRARYRVEVELYRQADNTLIFSFLEYSPTSAGRLTIDVAMPLNEYTTQEPWNLNYGITATIGIPQTFRKCWRNASPTALGFYIKYREVWTGSAESQTSDSANPSWAVKGARQIGELYGGYLKEYSETTGRKFLTKLTSPRIWRDSRIMQLSFIEPTNPPSTSNRLMTLREYVNNAGTIILGLYELPNLTGADAAGIYDQQGDVISQSQYLIYDKQFNAGTSWVNLGDISSFPTVTLGPGAGSKDYAIPVILYQGLTYNMRVSWQVSAGAGAETMTMRVRAVRLDQTTVEATFTSATLGQNQARDEVFTLTPAAANAHWLFIDLTCSAGVNNRTGLVAYPRVLIDTTVPRIDLRLITRDDTAKTITEGISETLQHQVMDAPDQPLQLIWRNSLGGASTWVFGHTQEYTYRFQDYKRKRYILYAQHLTLAEWDALNELNAIGDVYQVPIQELTTLVNKSHARRASQVYLVDPAGKQTGVIMIPTEVKTRTRRNQHAIELTVELPEIQAPA